ncbi:MAG: polymer-forming cytoskeletal protein [Sphingobacteriaceae bacterium]
MSLLPKKLDLNDNQISIISESFEIEGKIKAKSFVRIDGIIHGDVFVEEGLIMGEKAIINGDIKTKEAIIFGTLNGNLQVDSLEVKSTGKVNGEIVTQLLQMDPGAKYNGKISMNEEKGKQSNISVNTEAVKDAANEDNNKNNAK